MREETNEHDTIPDLESLFSEKELQMFLEIDAALSMREEIWKALRKNEFFKEEPKALTNDSE